MVEIRAAAAVVLAFLKMMSFILH